MCGARCGGAGGVYVGVGMSHVHKGRAGMCMRRGQGDEGSARQYGMVGEHKRLMRARQGDGGAVFLYYGGKLSINGSTIANSTASQVGTLAVL